MRCCCCLLLFSGINFVSYTRSETFGGKQIFVRCHVTLTKSMRVGAVEVKFQLYNNGREINIYENNGMYPWPLIFNEGFTADLVCNNSYQVSV